MIDAGEIFSPKDFESIRLTVHFKNFTTGTEVKDTSRTSLVEIGDKRLVLELPARSCNEKHNVMVQICRLESAKDPKDKKKKKERQLLSVTGKILTLDELDDDYVRVTVDCVQYDEKSWTDLLALYSNRQAEIDNFLAAVRGF